jgi:hypothetical protein
MTKPESFDDQDYGFYCDFETDIDNDIEICIPKKINISYQVNKKENKKNNTENIITEKECHDHNMDTSTVTHDTINKNNKVHIWLSHICFYSLICLYVYISFIDR